MSKVDHLKIDPKSKQIRNKIKIEFRTVTAKHHLDQGGH